MDLSKYLLEKLIYFIAGIIPGFVALSIYQLAVPGSFGWFFTLGFLGYKTKIAIVLLSAFIIGNSMTQFLTSILGATGGVLGARKSLREAQKPYKPAHSYDVAPWRDLRWRIALKGHLGGQAPNDSRLVSQQILTLKHTAMDTLPEAERPGAHAKVESDRIQTEIDDGNWAQWYDHFHQIVLSGQEKRDIRWHVYHDLGFNLEASALYVLISAMLVPDVRHWWCILPACMWVLVLYANEYSGLKNAENKWSTLSEQTKYLMAQEHLKEPPTAK
jgi:hypothetical protein